jgi:DNA-binding transcriptional regulator YdaS (Cro superfamily)
MSDSDTTALHKLKAWMSEQPKKRTQKWLADQLGVSPPSVFAWLKGRSRPEPPSRTAIEALTGIPVDDWWTHSERAAFDTTVRKIARTGTEG